MKRIFRIAAFATVALPALAFASTSTTVLTEVAGLFNIIVGVVFVVACLTFGGGLITWAVRLGVWPSHRDEAIKILEWGVAMLFTLVVVLGVVEFVESHTNIALQIVGILVVILAIWIVIASGILSSDGKKAEKEKEE
jgi:hypothetical protein